MLRLISMLTRTARRCASKLAITFAAVGAASATYSACACPVGGVCAAQQFSAPLQQVVVPQYVTPVQAFEVQSHAIPVVQRQVAVHASAAPVVQRQVVLRNRVLRRPLLQRQVIRLRNVTASAAIVY